MRVLVTGAAGFLGSHLTDRLLELVPGNMDQILYANSGAEAVENAVKLAKGTLRRPGVIGFQNAFHGRTHLAMSLTNSQVHYRGHMQPLVGSIFSARYCDPYHTPTGVDATQYALDDVRRVLRSEIYGEDVACILAEPLQGEGGFIEPTTEFMQELRAICDEIGAYLIIDEIQAGMGRTGAWFCHEHYGVEADIVTLAKGIASGVPLAAIVSRKEIWDKVTPGSMGGTLGGNALACAAGREAARVLDEEAVRVPVHRRRARQGAHGRYRAGQAGHQGAGGRQGQGVSCRRQQAPPHPHGRRHLRQLRALPAGPQPHRCRPRRRLRHLRRGLQGSPRLTFPTTI